MTELKSALEQFQRENDDLRHKCSERRKVRVREHQLFSEIVT